MIQAHPLLVKAAVAFDESKHPRGEHGRFAAGSAPRRVDGSLVVPQRLAAMHDTPQRRTQERLSSVWRTGSQIHALPIEYTGSTERELPIGSFLPGTKFATQKPKAMPVAEHQALLGRLVQIMHGEREATIAAGAVPKRKGKMAGQTLIPPGTERRAIVRAYNHGARLALHDYGIGTYDFHMDRELKAEMTPLVPFIRYARRRNISVMRGTQKGLWKPYRAEFGQPFADRRRDKVNGEVRLRVPANDVLVKFDDEEHPRDENGRWVATTANEHPYLVGGAAGTVSGAAASLAHGAVADATGYVRGSPGKAKPKLMDRIDGYKLGEGPKAKEKRFNTGTLRDWQMAHSTNIAMGGIGAGSKETQYSAGFVGPDRHIARMDRVTNRRLGVEDDAGTKRLWRGVHGEDAVDWNALKPGDIKSIDNHSSWSKSSKVASGFAKPSPDQPRTRIVLSNLDALRAQADLTAPDIGASGAFSSEKEVVLGRGSRVQVNRIKTVKGRKVIFATALGQTPQASFRRGVIARAKSAHFQAGRGVRGAFLGFLAGPTLGYTTHGWLWGQKVPSKPDA